MAHNGWSNEHTWAVVAAADNTSDFYCGPRKAIRQLARTGDLDGSAARLRQQVVDERVLGDAVPSWADLSQVDWTEIVTSWAQED